VTAILIGCALAAAFGRLSILCAVASWVMLLTLKPPVDVSERATLKYLDIAAFDSTAVCVLKLPGLSILLGLSTSKNLF